MKTLSALASLILFALAAPLATAQPYQIGDVAIAPEFADRAAEYGQRDIEGLVNDLRLEVDSRLRASGHLAGDGETAGRIDLVLVNATPNRPTFTQMGARPGLSFDSISRGGATLEAIIHDAEGAEIDRVRYSWDSPDIRDSRYKAVWGDARTAIVRFARRLDRELGD